MKAHLLGAIAALFMASDAQAVTVSVSPLMPANDGQFDDYVSNCFNCNDAPLSGLGQWIPAQAGIFDHSVLGYSQEPPNGGTYYSVYNGLTLKLNAATASNDYGVSFVWGSPSEWNVFAAGTFVINGQTILNLLPANDPYGALVTITGLPSFNDMTFNEDLINPITHQPGPAFAFEFDNLKVLYPYTPPPCDITAAPEPSTWAMMLLGFAGLGYAGYRKAHTPRLATIA